MSKTNPKKAGKNVRINHSKGIKDSHKNLIQMGGESSRGAQGILGDGNGQYRFNVDLLDSIFDAAIGY